jgi:hypothetical protein
MARIPSSVAEFLSGKRFAVAGSRGTRSRRRTRVRCYPDLASVPGSLDGVVVVTHPRNALSDCRILW